MTISITSHTTAPKPPKPAPRTPKASFAEVLGVDPDSPAASAANGAPSSQARLLAAENPADPKASTPTSQLATAAEAQSLPLNLAAARQIREEALHAFGFNQLGLLGLGIQEAAAQAPAAAYDAPTDFNGPSEAAQTVSQNGGESQRPGGEPARIATTTPLSVVSETAIVSRHSQIGLLASASSPPEQITEPLAFTDVAAPASPTKRQTPVRRAATQQAPGVAVTEEDGVVHLAALSPGLGPGDREQLRRQAASLIESYGLNLGSVTLNGETFARPYVSTKGGAHGG